MKKTIVVRVPEYKDPLEDMIASTDYSLEGLIGIKETSPIKTEADIDSIKPILKNIEKKLDEQNHKKEKTSLTIKNDDAIKSNIGSNLHKDAKFEKENTDSKGFTAIESALFIRFIFDELIGEQKWNVKGSKEIAEKLFRIPKATYEKKAAESRNPLGGYQRAREYEASLEKISNILKSFYFKEDEDEKSEDFKHLKNIIEKVTWEKDNAEKQEIQKHRQKIPKSELKEQFYKA